MSAKRPLPDRPRQATRQETNAYRRAWRSDCIGLTFEGGVAVMMDCHPNLGVHRRYHLVKKRQSGVGLSERWGPHVTQLCEHSTRSAAAQLFKVLNHVHLIKIAKGVGDADPGT